MVIYYRSMLKAKSFDTNKVMPWGKKYFDLVKFFLLPKMLEIMNITDIYKWVLISDPPFVHESRIQCLKMANWRTVERRAAAPPDLLARRHRFEVHLPQTLNLVIVEGA